MKKLLAVILCLMIAVFAGTSVMAEELEEYEEFSLDVGTGVEDTVEDDSKGCVGGSTMFPFTAVVIAGALVIFKKRA